MKNIYLIVIAIGLAFSATAQIDRSKAPEPGPAPEIKIGEYESFTLDNGLKVFVVENRKLPRVSFNLILDRDPVLEGDKSGYVSIAGSLLREGTTNRTKTELDEEVDFIGGRLSTSSNSVFASSLSDYDDKMMELMADVMLNPAFPEESFEKLKKQNISSLEASEKDPNAIANRVFDVLLYGKSHPYGELMTEETINNITLDDCKGYYETYFQPNIAYLAVVGDIDKEEARELVEKHLGSWSGKEVPEMDYDDPGNPSQREVAIVNREDAVQSVINIGNVTELPPGSPEIIPLRIGNQILGGGSMGRLFQNLREDKAFTYGAYSSYDSDRLIGSFSASASVRNEVTDSAVTEFYKELTGIRDKQITPEELKNAQNYITGSFARSLESPQTIARFAINTERYNLPADYYQNYLKNVSAVTVEQVQQATRKHILPDNSTVLVVGKASDIADGMEQFGNITYYDTEGNQVEKPTFREADISAKEVIEKYIDAIGGKEAVTNINDLVVKMEGSLQGQDVSLTRKAMSPYYASTIMNLKMGEQEMELMAMKYDGEQMTRVVQGNPTPIEEEELKEAKYNNRLFPELQYLDSEGFEMEAVAIKTIDGQDAYEVKVTYPTGKEVTEYYSVESGFKLRETETQEGPDGGQMTLNSDFKDYREVNGVMFPHTYILPLGQMELRMDVTDIELNTGLKKDEFEVEK